MNEYKYKWQVTASNGQTPADAADASIPRGLRPAGEWYPFGVDGRIVRWRRPLESIEQPVEEGDEDEPVVPRRRGRKPAQPVIPPILLACIDKE